MARKAEIEKDNFITQASFDPKKINPKQLVNYDKYNLQQNSLNGPKDPNSEKMPKKVTKSFKMC